MKTYKIISFTLLLFFLHSGTLIQAQPGRWAEPVNISNTNYYQGYSDLITGNDSNIHTVWEDGSRIQGGVLEMDIMYTYFDGHSWAEGEIISPLDSVSTYSLRPKIALDSQNRPHTVWGHRAIYPEAAVYYTMKTDFGWLEPIDISREMGTSYKPHIAIDSEDNIHISWSGYEDGSWGVFYTKFDGQSWSDYIRITDVNYDAGLSKIVIDSNDNIHLVCGQASENSSSEIWKEKPRLFCRGFVISAFWHFSDKPLADV